MNQRYQPGAGNVNSMSSAGAKLQRQPRARRADQLTTRPVASLEWRIEEVVQSGDPPVAGTVVRRHLLVSNLTVVGPCNM